MERQYTKEEIIAQAKNLAKMIAQTEEVDFFKRAEKQINEHTGVQRAMAKIKRLQKEAVNLQHYGKENALKEIDEKIDAIQDEIDDIPLVQEFKRSQTEVNNILQLVSTTISNTVTNEIIKSTGGDLLKGTTASNR